MGRSAGLGGLPPFPKPINHTTKQPIDEPNARPSQVSVLGRFQLLEVDLPPSLTRGAPVEAVRVKLYKHTQTLRVEMTLAGGGGGSGCGGSGAGEGAPGGRPQGQRQGQRRAQRQAAQGAAPGPVVVDWWSSGRESLDMESSSCGASASASAPSSAGPSTPRAGAGAAGSAASSGPASDVRCEVVGAAAGAGARGGPGSAGALSSSLTLHTSMSTGDLFNFGLRQTVRAEQVLRRLSQHQPLPPGGLAVGASGGGEAGE